MSKFNMYTMYDKIAKRGSGIYLAVNDIIADRQMKQTLKQMKKEAPHIQIEDLELLNLGVYEMGEDDKMTGIIKAETYKVASIPAGKIPEDFEEKIEE